MRIFSMHRAQRAGITLLVAVGLLLPLAASAQANDFVDGQAATAVVGQADLMTIDYLGPEQSFMNPHGVAVDNVRRKLYIADSEHSRVLRYDLDEALAGSPTAEAVFGQVDLTEAAGAGSPDQYKLSQSWDVAVDPATGDLYVADTFHSRVVRFDAAHTAANLPAASLVLGKADFTSTDTTVSRTTTEQVFAVEIGPRGELWVADGARILRWNNPRSLANGAPADAVLGKPDFTTGTGGGEPASQTNVFGVYGLAVSPDGALYAADTFASRVLRWDDAYNATNGAPADAVFGQSDFTTDTQGIGAAGLNIPEGIAVDANGRLYVADSGSGRVVWYDNADTAGNGVAADGVLGHVDLDGTVADGNERMLAYPRALALGAAHELWVVDRPALRVMLFSYTPPEDEAETEPTPDAAAVQQCGQLPDMAVSPELIELAPGGTAQIEVALRNLCKDKPFSSSDVLLSLSDGLVVTDVPTGWLNLGQRAAWQNLSLDPDETVRAVITVSAPNGVPAGPTHVTELYALGRMQRRIDGVFITPAAVVPPVAEAPAVPAGPAPLPAVLPNTAGPLLPLGVLALSGLALAAAGAIGRRLG
jgi:sugar lactone lactonase YvrE